MMEHRQKLNEMKPLFHLVSASSVEFRVTSMKWQETLIKEACTHVSKSDGQATTSSGVNGQKSVPGISVQSCNPSIQTDGRRGCTTRSQSRSFRKSLTLRTTLAKCCVAYHFQLCLNTSVRTELKTSYVNRRSQILPFIKSIKPSFGDDHA